LRVGKLCTKQAVAKWTAPYRVLHKFVNMPKTIYTILPPSAQSVMCDNHYPRNCFCVQQQPSFILTA
jgi:hypothetical protein